MHNTPHGWSQATCKHAVRTTSVDRVKSTGAKILSGSEYLVLFAPPQKKKQTLLSSPSATVGGCAHHGFLMGHWLTGSVVIRMASALSALRRIYPADTWVQALAQANPVHTVTGHIHPQAPQHHCALPEVAFISYKLQQIALITTDIRQHRAHAILGFAQSANHSRGHYVGQRQVSRPTWSEDTLCIQHACRMLPSTSNGTAGVPWKTDSSMATKQRHIALQRQPSRLQPWQLPYTSTAAITAAIIKPPTAPITDPALLLAGFAAPAEGVSATALAGAPATAFAAFASMLLGSGCCSGAHCALGPALGRRPISSTHALTMSLEVGGTSACGIHKCRQSRKMCVWVGGGCHVAHDVCV